jgi:diguanylate cyclase (GGDEF)-like protein/PAS domain S-box-containing protein
MRDTPKSHLVTENADRMQGRTAVHLDAPAAERQRRERALKSSEIRYRRLFETAPYGILVLDAETGVVVDANPAICRLLGYDTADMLEHPLWSVPAFKNAAATNSQFRELITQPHLRYDDLPLETKDGKIKRVELVSTLFLADSKQFVQCVIHDITELVQRAAAEGERAEQQEVAASLDVRQTADNATHDEATGLVNRWYFEEALPRELHRAERAKTPLTLTALVLDNYSELTERFGTDAVDAMLREVGRIIREHLRKSDMACRYATQEFVIVLPDSTPRATSDRIEKIRMTLRNLDLHHGSKRLDAPVLAAGVATAGERADGTSSHDLLAAAHAALNAASSTT